MASQIRSRTEYLIPTDNTLGFLLHSNLILKSDLTGMFSIRFNDNSEVAYFLLGHLVFVILDTKRCKFASKSESLPWPSCVDRLVLVRPSSEYLPNGDTLSQKPFLADKCNSFSCKNGAELSTSLSSKLADDFCRRRLSLYYTENAAGSPTFAESGKKFDSLMSAMDSSKW